jgi:CRP-like cAMP-binding protein
MLDSLIAQHSFFRLIPQSARYGLLREFRQIKIRANEVVFEDGEAGDSALVVISGCLCLLHGGSSAN